MSDPETVTIPVTVTVKDFDPDHVQDGKNDPLATFEYSGADLDAKGQFQTQTQQVTVYQFTPLDGSAWTQAPLTALPQADWLVIDGWEVTIKGNLLEKGASASFRLSVVQDKVTYVGDPTIIMVDPPGQYRKHQAA